MRGVKGRRLSLPDLGRRWDLPWGGCAALHCATHHPAHQCQGFSTTWTCTTYLYPLSPGGPAPANRPASNPVRQRNVSFCLHACALLSPRTKPHKPLNVADKPNLHGTIHRVVSRRSRAVSCLAAGGRPSVSARAPKSPAHRRVVLHQSGHVHASSVRYCTVSAPPQLRCQRKHALRRAAK